MNKSDLGIHRKPKRFFSASYKNAYQSACCDPRAFNAWTSVQGAVPSVPPEILAQLKSMSPAQQRAMARQYGFNLDECLATLEETMILVSDQR